MRCDFLGTEGDIVTQSLTQSVGQGGGNKPVDVATVQVMLSSLPVDAGGRPEILADGIFGPDTLSAINDFQQVQFNLHDGLVQPHDFTMNRLNILTDVLTEEDPITTKVGVLLVTLTLVDIGTPTGDVRTADGVGIAQSYTGGNIYHHPSLGTFEVHGSILDEYIQQDEESGALGYPISDERQWVPGGVDARVSHFQLGSIFFTPPAGASVLVAPGTT